MSTLQPANRVPSRSTSPVNSNRQHKTQAPTHANTGNAPRRNTPSDTFELETTHPLMETERVNPPLANPETDEDGADDREIVNKAQPGVDDGFFDNRANEDGPTVNPPDVENIPTDDVNNQRPHARGPTPRIPAAAPHPRPDFSGSDKPTSPFPAFPDLEFGTIAPDLETIPDVNVYQHKKTLAQGMMDLALFSANANQLRYVLDSSSHPYYYSGVVLISISLIFQVAVGVGLIWNSRYNIKDEREICIANKINNFTIIGIFLVTVVNVFISAFGVASVQPIVVRSGS